MLLHFGTGADDKLLTMPGETAINTTEGKTAVEEAIEFLNTTTPVSPVKWD